MRIALIIPCYNEEKRIEDNQFLSFIDHHQNYDFYFVNDGSTDNTKNILSQLKIQRPKRVTLINQEINHGKAESTRRGVLEALKFEYDYIGYWDADLATPLDLVLDFEKLLRKESFDFVLYSRKKTTNSNINRNSFRHFLGRIIANFANLIHGLPIYDSQCGAKLFSREAINISFQHSFITRWCFDVEILIRLKRAKKVKFLEMYPRVYNHKKGSKITLMDVLQSPFDLMKIFIHYRN